SSVFGQSQASASDPDSNPDSSSDSDSEGFLISTTAQADIREDGHLPQADLPSSQYSLNEA
ncbi:MAG: hypothetical protein Q8P67_19865, partial [archaeon]|nr:hypothetical protein [archaeon]